MVFVNKHISYGFKDEEESSIANSMFDIHQYGYDASGVFDYDSIEQEALKIKPKLIVCGAAKYPKLMDVKRFRKIADSCGALLMFDMSNYVGLIAAEIIENDLKHAHIITATSDGVLQGPRLGMIFALKSEGEVSLIDKINEAVFPGFQGGPHNHYITALAHSLHLASGTEFKEFQKQALFNSKSLAKGLQKRQLDVFLNGTENHTVIMDLNSINVDGRFIRYWFDKLGILTKTAPLLPNPHVLREPGLWMGTVPMTMRGLKENDFDVIAEIIRSSINVGLNNDLFKSESQFVSKVDRLLESDEDTRDVKEAVQEFASRFTFY